IRNRAARFLNTQLTMDAALSYNDIPAIRGHVETLETFDPAKALQLAPDSNKADGVVPGAMLNQAFPTLAPVDKARHIGGTVLVHSMITTQGTVGAVIVVASPDPALTAAVVTAAKKTTYTPFLLNGQPIEAEMTDTFTLIDNN
ncbi:MAG: TonB family protein, partial [Acidobacteriota bacterium]